MLRVASRCCLGLLSLAVACSDEEESCRCGPAISIQPGPFLPPAQPPATSLGAPFTLLDGAVRSANESIQGSFTLRESELGSSVALRAGKPSEVCAAGHLGALPNDGDDDSYWGAEVSMTLNELPVAAAKPWQRDGVIGFAFDLSGTIPLDVRPAITLRDRDLPFEGYCQMLSPRDGDTQYVLFEQLKTSCWDPDVGQPLPEGPLLRFGWYVPASAAIATDLDFCISDVRPIRAAGE